MTSKDLLTKCLAILSEGTGLNFEVHSFSHSVAEVLFRSGLISSSFQAIVLPDGIPPGSTANNIYFVPHIEDVLRSRVVGFADLTGAFRLPISLSHRFPGLLQHLVPANELFQLRGMREIVLVLLSRSDSLRWTGNSFAGFWDKIRLEDAEKCLAELRASGFLTNSQLAPPRKEELFEAWVQSFDEVYATRSFEDVLVGANTKAKSWWETYHPESNGAWGGAIGAALVLGIPLEHEPLLLHSSIEKQIPPERGGFPVELPIAKIIEKYWPDSLDIIARNGSRVAPLPVIYIDLINSEDSKVQTVRNEIKKSILAP